MPRTVAYVHARHLSRRASSAILPRNSRWHGDCDYPIMKTSQIGIIYALLASVWACGGESSDSKESQGERVQQANEALKVNVCAQHSVDLRSAANFAVLAGSTVTNTGPTVVTGDLGVSPGTAVTGFLPGIVVGTQHRADPTAANAELDLTIAYNDAAGRTLCPVSIAGNLGGLTLAPGPATAG